MSEKPVSANRPKSREQKQKKSLNTKNIVDSGPIDVATDSAVLKLLEYAKKKQVLSYDELQDFLPENITSTDKIEQVLALLESNNIQLVEEDTIGDGETEPEDSKSESGKKRLVYAEKESSADDPIRLYLREIGKEKLLTAIRK